MKTLRSTLMIAVWAAGLVLFAVTTRPFPTVELIAGVLLAMLAGLLLSKGSLRSSSYVVWANAFGGLLWAMAFAPDMFAGAWLAGVCAYGLLFSLERAFLRPRAVQAHDA